MSYMIGLAPSFDGFRIVFFVTIMFMVYGLFVGVALCSYLNSYAIAADTTHFSLVILSFMATNRSRPMISILEWINYASPYK